MVVRHFGKLTQPQNVLLPAFGARSTLLTPQLAQVGRQYSPSSATSSGACCCCGVRVAIRASRLAMSCSLIPFASPKAMASGVKVEVVANWPRVT
jgi:hypothetical protein